ncbi:hypothetical protein ACFQ9Q_35655 [Streptomyces virginiae]|uniref:hypothetical protein n=1 Tax=Streptomyces virginiae TaxID=1961 RepID=UPI0036A65A9C
MTESGWHKEIKGWGVESEVRIGNRRTDCYLRCGKRAEVQSRGLPPVEVMAREAHTDLWILNCRAAHRTNRLPVWEDPELGCLFRWDHSWQGFAVAKRPVYLNLELNMQTGKGRFLEVTAWTFDGYRTVGTGQVHTAAAMRSWMRYDIPLAAEKLAAR